MQKSRKAQELLELVHTDVYGPMLAQAKGGYEYFITFTNEYSRYGYVYLMRRKSETFESSKSLELKLRINWVNT